MAAMNGSSAKISFTENYPFDNVECRISVAEVTVSSDDLFKFKLSFPLNFLTSVLTVLLINTKPSVKVCFGQ